MSKDIKLLTLRIENFKCHRNLIINFDGMDKSIYGDNAMHLAGRKVRSMKLPGTK